MLNPTDSPTREQLLADLHEFVNATGMSESALGRAAINDARLVPELRKGRGITIDTYDRLRAWMLAERRRRGLDEAEAAARKALAPPAETTRPFDARAAGQAARNGAPGLLRRLLKWLAGGNR